jgi:7-cyano-7-deazaguanine synthase in queuosine biosynthesis
MGDRETKKLAALMKSAQPAIQAMMPIIQRMAAEAVKLADEIESSQMSESWPVYSDGDYIMCGSDGCGCEMEDSVILIPFESLDPAKAERYTAGQLLAAVRDHIEQQSYRDEEKGED